MVWSPWQRLTRCWGVLCHTTAMYKKRGGYRLQVLMSEELDLRYLSILENEILQIILFVYDQKSFRIDVFNDLVYITETDIHMSKLSDDSVILSYKERRRYHVYLLTMSIIFSHIKHTYPYILIHTYGYSSRVYLLTIYYPRISLICSMEIQVRITLFVVCEATYWSKILQKQTGRPCVPTGLGW